MLLQIGAGVLINFLYCGDDELAPALWSLSEALQFVILGLPNSLKCGSFAKIQTAQGYENDSLAGWGFQENQFHSLPNGLCEFAKIKNCDDLRCV